MTLLSASVERRLSSIRRLAKEYFDLPKGALIEHDTELLRLFDVRASRHSDHPHKMMRVYITRRALKHVVESRREELLVRHSPEEAIEAICFALDHLRETITDFDKYDYEPPTHGYHKDYSGEGRPRVRVLLEITDGILQIKSIQFTKRK